ncbi:MAG TPA: substrate-binding domain-containing protein [Xanthobacteraceae bacterium]|jgi:molybdate transport system substrate-binding protein|nr:substrate-binding domain-containing protein [Xanthobacteraceae bacterium]
MPLRILSAGSTLHGLQACAELAAQALGGPLTLATDHGHNIREAVLRGDAAADVVLVPADMADALAAKGLVRETAPLGTVGIGGVVGNGGKPPGISTMAELREALLKAELVYLTRAPTGEHLFKVITELGLRDAMTQKLHAFDTAKKLIEDIAVRVQTALGFAPETEIRAAKGVTWVGDVPPEIQVALPYEAVMLKTAPDIARDFLSFLKTPAAEAAFAASGVRNAR